MNKLTKSIYRSFVGSRFPYCLIVIGIVLRFKHFLENRSLWLDEAWVALGVSSHSFQEILSLQKFSDTYPLPPLGFILIEKLGIHFLGNNEHVLRLFPLLASVLSLFLFYSFLKRYVHFPQAIPIAMALFALSEPLIYYAAEVKQYSGDLLITLVLYLATDSIRRKDLSIKGIYFLGVIGVLAIICSHVSVFVLASVGLVLIASNVVDRKKSNLISLLCVVGLWAGCFTILYLTSYQWMVKSQQFTGNNRYLAVLPLWSSQGRQWLSEALLGMFHHPLSITPAWLWFSVTLLGMIVYAKKNRREFFLLILPLGFVLLTSIMQKYPFGGRFILFCMPAICIFLTSGIVKILHATTRYRKLVSILLLSVLFYQPVKEGLYYLKYSRSQEESRPVMQFFIQHFQPGDEVYINNSAIDVYNYYLTNLHFPYQIQRVGKILDQVYGEEAGCALIRYETQIFRENGWLLGIKDNEELNQYYQVFADRWIKPQGNNRVWVIFVHYNPKLESLVISSLNRHGKRLKRFQAKNAAVYLYDLNFNR